MFSPNMLKDVLCITNNPEVMMTILDNFVLLAVNPLARVASDVDTDLQLSGPGLSAHYFGTPGLKPENQSAKRKRTPSKRKRNDELA